MKIDKYQACGNSFFILDNISQKVEIRSFDIKILCQQYSKYNPIGGADGFIIIEKTDKADFLMKFYNDDGKIATMCGNGARCAVKYAYQNGYIKEIGTFLAGDGIHSSNVLPNGDICISIKDVTEIQQIENGFFLNTGVPHFVLFKENLKELEVVNTGWEISHKNCFGRERTNVDFVEILEDGKYYIRTYERGVEYETLSCGTGMVAAAIVLNYSRFNDVYNFNLIAEGGIANVCFNRDGEKFVNIKLTGPAECLYNLELKISSGC